MAWRVIAEPGDPKVRISGPDGQHVFEVFQGTITRELRTALHALAHPKLRQKIREGFTVTCPWRHRAFDNRGENRQFVLIRPPGRRPLELRLTNRHATISKAFLHSLRDVIERRQEPGTTNAENSARFAAGQIRRWKGESDEGQRQRGQEGADLPEVRSDAWQGLDAEPGNSPG